MRTPSILNLKLARNRLATGLGRIFLVLLMLGMLILTTVDTSIAAPATTKLDPNSYIRGDIIVKFKGVDALDRLGGFRQQQALADRPSTLLNDAFVKNFKASRFQPLFGVPGYFVYKIDPQADMEKALAAFRLNPNVAFAEPNFRVTVARTPNDKLYRQSVDDGATQVRQWYLKRIGIEEFWNDRTGNNQVIAILDTGIDRSSPDLTGKVIEAKSIDLSTDGEGGVGIDAAIDTDGHGTAVAGIIAARTDNDSNNDVCRSDANITDVCSVAGINWDRRANLLAVKVVDTAPGQPGLVTGSLVSIATGIFYATDNQARIINMSLNLVPTIAEKQSKLLEDAINYANSKGVLIVTSAANQQGSARLDFAVQYPNVMVVAATDQQNRVVSVPSQFVSIAAPGVNIFTTVITPTNPGVGCNNTNLLDCYASAGGGTYDYVSGSSYAAAIVTGLASLVIDYDLNISNVGIKNVIEGTADDIDVPGRDASSGFGLVNATRLIQRLREGNRVEGRKTILAGTIFNANYPDVVMSLDPVNISQTPNSIGGYRFENLDGDAVYDLRLTVPKRGIVLGPIRIFPSGRDGEFIFVNFDVAAFRIICGERAACPSNNPGGPPAPPTPPPPTNPFRAFFLPAAPIPGARFFPETGHNLGGAFRAYWESRGGLEVFGFPKSEEFQEVSQTDGRTYIVQYFERNRFEFHPENPENSRVLLGLLGSESTRGRNFPPGTSVPTTPSQTYFPETGHTLSGVFYDYWRRYGGLAIFGYPISEPLQEGGLLVQYFERNRFEFHPENRGTRYEVLLGLLGNDLARSRGYID
jgi:subtilisin family serine protease